VIYDNYAHIYRIRFVVGRTAYKGRVSLVRLAAGTGTGTVVETHLNIDFGGG